MTAVTYDLLDDLGFFCIYIYIFNRTFSRDKNHTHTDPGQVGTVTLELVDRDFQTFSIYNGTWITVPGIYTIFIGASSEDIRLTTTVTVA